MRYVRSYATSRKIVPLNPSFQFGVQKKLSRKSSKKGSSSSLAKKDEKPNVSSSAATSAKREEKKSKKKPQVSLPVLACLSPTYLSVRRVCTCFSNPHAVPS
jgi:hypothetical protein